MSIKRKFKKDFTSSFNINDDKANVKQKLEFKESFSHVKSKRPMAVILSFAASLLVIISASTLLVINLMNKKEANDSNNNNAMQETAIISQEVVAENSSFSLTESIKDDTVEFDEDSLSNTNQLDNSIDENITTEEKNEPAESNPIYCDNCSLVDFDENYYYVILINEISNLTFIDEKGNTLEFEIISDTNPIQYKIKKGDYLKIIASN